MTAPHPMPPPAVLETPRLVLRPVRRKDIPVIQHRFPHWEIVQYLDVGIPWPYPADGAALYVETCLAEMQRGEKAHWALIPKSGPVDLIGMISLWPDDGVSRNQRGFWLAREFQRRGLMSEAAERVTAYAFCDLGWPELWFANAQENYGSRRIKEKQGARLVDLMIGRFVSGPGPQMVWHLLRENWVARQAAQ
ncbi:Protein N-acetyltransferase, RimJ/RimL family [Enhydrobacter aerosaccus]|uniref:Protein N-acetyltransferase, RimJ/RimL family n=1 Tax=Enhydrobacter aerosaccus TaxID=225324 RepID=A0A1T4TN78_9HYPH|nr:GNAT family N-acetyltransferase [Enhydrobacter aerosaccus]SKA41943.1 Protein N-acetyltransferase, RimJ/RimL family [Enhydrobacter aerosaccus]